MVFIRSDFICAYVYWAFIQILRVSLNTILFGNTGVSRKCPNPMFCFHYIGSNRTWTWAQSASRRHTNNLILISLFEFMFIVKRGYERMLRLKALIQILEHVDSCLANINKLKNTETLQLVQHEQAWQMAGIASAAKKKRPEMTPPPPLQKKNTQSPQI